jgi:dynein heavy chain
VAPADLLDILSKGSNPQAILRHLSKCFDNVHNLSFRKDERGEPTKVRASVRVAGWRGCITPPHRCPAPATCDGNTGCMPCAAQAATGMYSGEGEYVEFASECACEGPVEMWLQSVVDSMKTAIQAEFKKCVSMCRVWVCGSHACAGGACPWLPGDQLVCVRAHTHTTQGSALV